MARIRARTAEDGRLVFVVEFRYPPYPGRFYAVAEGHMMQMAANEERAMEIADSLAEGWKTEWEVLDAP